jgi:hypothetical protein
MAGNENDWNLDIRFTQLALKIQTIEPRHPNVEDKTGRRIWALRKHEVTC